MSALLPRTLTHVLLYLRRCDEVRCYFTSLFWHPPSFSPVKFVDPRVLWVSIQPISLDLIWPGGSTSYFACPSPTESVYSYWGYPPLKFGDKPEFRS